MRCELYGWSWWGVRMYVVVWAAQWVSCGLYGRWVSWRMNSGGDREKVGLVGMEDENMDMVVWMSCEVTWAALLWYGWVVRLHGLHSDGMDDLWGFMGCMVMVWMSCEVAWVIHGGHELGGGLWVHVGCMWRVCSGYEGCGEVWVHVGFIWRVCSGCEGCGEVWVIHGGLGLHERVWVSYWKL